MTERRGKGEGAIYQRASDGRWVGVIDLGWAGGKRVRKTVTAKTKGGPNGVIAKMSKLRRSIEAGILPDDATVEQWLNHWATTIIPARDLKPSTIANYEAVCRLHLIPNLGRLPLQKLRPEHIRAMHQAMADTGAAQSTIVQAHAVLVSALTAAWSESRVVDNVAKKCYPKAAKPNHHRQLEAPAARAVLEHAAGGREFVRLACALALGMRQAEALGLRWESVTDTHVLVVQQVRRIRGELVVMGTKSSSSERALRLPDELAEAFASLRLMSGGDGYVFSDDGGVTPWSAVVDRERWKRALERAGVEYVPMHGARGSIASAMAEAGVRDQAISQALGHSRESTTRQSYTQMRDRLISEAISAGWDQVRPGIAGDS